MLNRKSFHEFSRKLTSFLPETALFTAFCIIQLSHINVDFWNDEIYTLKNFVFTPVSTTLTDYHVPNNHVFFNLINNVYLKLIDINSLQALMDAPYKLRLIPFLYSLLLFVFVYKTGNKFFNRSIALLALALLMTTIPFYYFSLQIRGYGLSTLLLVMVVYYSLAYLNSFRTKYLIAVALLTMLLIYTIPSNLYAIFGLLAFLGVHLLQITRKKMNEHKSKLIPTVVRSAPFILMSTLILGVALSLLLYSGIFLDVFMNDYVKSGEPFKFSKLQFYLPHLAEGILSKRWVLLPLVVFGILIGHSVYKRMLRSTLLILVVCVIPIFLVYARGDSTPLRTFTVYLPFFAFLFSIGIYALWRKINPAGKFDLLFGACILAYSLFAFNQEINKIENKLLSDINEQRRSQDFYHQYYSAYYQPLKDLTYFTQNLYDSEYPFIIMGCEPHGIPNYLERFKIPYFETTAFDSLLTIHDSLYIVTNHPNKFTGITEYNVDFLSQELTYHTILLFYKNQPFEQRIKKELDALKSKYGDSINYVFSIYKPIYLSTFAEHNSCYFITDENQDDFAKLIKFKNSKPFICYIETVERNSINTKAIIMDDYVSFNANPNSFANIFWVLKSDSTGFTKDKTLYFNDNENERIRFESHKLFDSNHSFSGNFSERLDSEIEYSSAFITKTNALKGLTTLKISMKAIFEKTSKGVIVVDVARNGKNIIWESQALSNFFSPEDKWNSVISTFSLEGRIKSNDKISIFIWNPEKELIWLDDFKVEVIGDE